MKKQTMKKQYKSPSVHEIIPFFRENLADNVNVAVNSDPTQTKSASQSLSNKRTGGGAGIWGDSSSDLWGGDGE